MSEIRIIKFGNILFLILFFIINFKLYSESVYTYNKNDIAITMISLGVALTGIFMPDELSIPPDLSKNDINIFDRELLFSYNEGLHKFRDTARTIIPYLSIITPLSLWGYEGWNFTRYDFDLWFTYGVMYSQAIALTLGTVYIMKKAINRYRPLVFYDDDTINYPIKDDCFPSDTTAITFMASTFFSVTFSAENPDSLWRIPVVIGSYTLATSVGVLSILSGMHFLTDIIAGAVIGSTYGWLIPVLHKRNNDKFVIYPMGNGILLSLKL